MKTAKQYLTVGPRVKDQSPAAWNVAIVTDDPHTTQSVGVESVQTQEAARRLADELGVTLRIPPYVLLEMMQEGVARGGRYRLYVSPKGAALTTGEIIVDDSDDSDVLAKIATAREPELTAWRIEDFQEGDRAFLGWNRD